MFSIKKNGNGIHSVEDWREYAPPKEREKHWKDGRSAKELAKAWFPQSGNPQIPAELTDLFQSHDATEGVIWDSGEPERIQCIDKFRGEQRNADLVLWGHTNRLKVVASIEAKADEPFGKIARDHIDESVQNNQESNVPCRFKLLCDGLGIDPNDAEELGYQLFTAACGALVGAQNCGANLTVFVVHEFIAEVADPQRVQINADALDAFVRLLTRGASTQIAPGQLVGPIAVPGNEHFAGTNALFIGKCRRKLKLQHSTG